jgi:hypothetical protein
MAAPTNGAGAWGRFYEVHSEVEPRYRKADLPHDFAGLVSRACWVSYWRASRLRTN